MRVNTKLQDSLLEIFKRGGVISADDLAVKLNIDVPLIRRLVSSIRKRNRKRGDVPYIYTTGHGYSTEEKASHVLYEGQMRLRMGVGILANGMPVFKKCKQLAAAQFNKINIELRPKMLLVNKIT